MASPFTMLGCFSALLALWLPAPGILLTLGPPNGTSDNVTRPQLFPVAENNPHGGTSASSPPTARPTFLSTFPCTGLPLLPSLCPSASIPLASSRALHAQAISECSVNRIIMEVLDHDDEHDTAGHYENIPPWPAWPQSVHLRPQYGHGTPDHGRYSPSYAFLCELITGIVFNAKWSNSSFPLAIAVCILAFFIPTVIKFTIRLLLSTIVYVIMHYLRLLARIAFLIMGVGTLIFGLIGHMITCCVIRAITVTTRILDAITRQTIWALWSPITTVILIVCRILLSGENILRYAAVKAITFQHGTFTIRLQATTRYVERLLRAAPEEHVSLAQYALGIHRYSKRRNSIRARYLAIRIAVDDYSSAKTFLYVLLITLVKGTLQRALHATCNFHCMAIYRTAQPVWYIQDIAVAAACRLRYHRTPSCALAMLRRLASNVSLAALLTCSVMLDTTSAGSSEDEKRGPPKFSGEKTAFVGWFMLMSAYVAWKLHSSASIFEEIRTAPPPPPEPILGRVAPRPPDAPAPILNADGITIDNQADIVAAAAAMAAWSATPTVIINAAEIQEAQEASTAFLEDNIRLYGLIVQSLPPWLVTSVYNAHRNDGLATVRYLRAAFDARGGDSGDHAAQLAKLQLRYIDSRNTLNVEDVRKQFDAMMTAVAAIERTGNPRPSDPTLIAMYENSLPPAYSQIRQLTRRAGHRTFLDYHMDVMSQVSAELTASAPAAHAFQGLGRRVGNPSTQPPPHNSNGGGTNPCIQCGTVGHLRPNCTSNPVKCTGCGAPNHLEAFCSKGSGSRRNELTPNGLKLIERDIKALKKRPPHASPSSYAAAAAQPPPTTPSAPTPAPSTAVLPPLAPQVDSTAAAQAHAAAVHAAQGHADPLAAINAYASAMRVLGHGFMAMAAPPPPMVMTSGSTPRPDGSALHALVDTMATFWIVPSTDYLWTINAMSPGFGVVETANGPVTAEAVGVSLVWLLVGKAWECYEVPNVLVLPGCPAVLYSTRVMRELFGMSHDTDNNRIGVPGRPDIEIHNDGSSYSIPVIFASRDTKRPRRVISSLRSPVALLSTLLSAFPVGISGTTQATLHHRLGFPYADQWRHVPTSTTGHGLPINSRVSTDLPVREAILRGRARAAKWHSAIADHAQPPPAAMFYMDFAGPLLPSIFNKFTCYAGVVDAGSSYGRLFPCHGMTAEAARIALETFTADVAARMGFHGIFKPLIVRSDQGSAFVSSHFREFLLAHQIKQSLAAVYTPQQNSHIERFWGVVFGTARVLLAAANLPPSFHAFALQTAAWIHNRLPRPSLGNVSPFYVLSRSQPALDDLYTFGCLASTTIPLQKRDGDRHFADRGEYVLYLGPSEVSPAHVVYLLSSKRITAVPKLRVWEDEFPGIKGERYAWFADMDNDGITDTHDVPQLSTHPSPALAAPPAAPPEAPPPAAALPPDTPFTPAPLTRGAITPVSQSRGALSPSALPTPRTQPAPPLTVPFDFPTSVAPTVQAPQAPPIAPRGDHGGHADTDPRLNDPRSRHFLRPQRPTRAARDNHPHGHSQYNRAILAQSMSSFALFAIAFSAIFQGPPPPPIFAFESHTSDISSLFTPYDPDLPDGDLTHVASRSSLAFAVTLTIDLGNVVIPKSYRQAVNGPHASYWKEAIAKELGGLISLHTWDLLRADLMPSDANLMHCHFVFAVKRKADGSIEKFKARLVADGNTQKEGIDFDRIFATVVKTSTIRLLLILAAAHDYNLSSIDIRQAYLQAELTGDLYMRCPPGVWPFDAQHRPLVCKLRRSLYGLKQAGREWALLFTSFLLTWGMCRSIIDSCLYTYFEPESIFFLAVAVYVDDALIVDNCELLRNRFVIDLSKRFPTEDKGPLEWILNVAIVRDRPARSITLSQSLYVNDLLSKYGHWADTTVTHVVNSPLEEGTKLSPDDQPTLGSTEYDNMAPRREAYMSIVGGLLWLANMTMPHLAYAASQLSRFLTNPGPSHFTACVRVLVYLRSVPNQALRFTPNVTRLLDTFVDSNWDTKFSCSGCLIFFYGCLFHWFSKMQHSVSLSSAEAEYFGAMMTARELIWIRDLLFDLNISLNGPSVIYSDSRSAILMAFDPVAFKKTKHILRAAEFLRDNVAKEILTLKHVAGNVNIADILTKAVSRAIYSELMRLLDNYAQTGVVSL